MDPDDIRLLENLWQRVWMESDQYASRSNLEHAFVHAIQGAASRGRFRFLRAHANWLRAPLPVDVRVDIEDERSAHMSLGPPGYLRGDDIEVNIRIFCTYFEDAGSYWNMRYHYDRREVEYQRRVRQPFPEDRLAQMREEMAKSFKDNPKIRTAPAFDPALSGLNVFIAIVRVIADAVALKMAANLSLRPYTIVKCKRETKCVCSKHGLVVGTLVPSDSAVPIYTIVLPDDAMARVQTCKTCYEEAEKLHESFKFFIRLCALGVKGLWDQIDDTSKRFGLVKEEREFDPEHPSIWGADPNRDFAERLALIELSDVPEPVKTPPKVFIPVPRPVEVREHSSEIDKWGGVGELLLELN